MPGYVIHLAVGKVYNSNNEIQNTEKFLKGIIAPDLAKDKAKSHYGPYSSKPNLEKFLNESGISNSFQEGYFLHLVTDYLFYNKFLQRWDRSIYDDYDKLNKRIIEKYELTIPKEIENEVGFKVGNLSILEEDKVFEFIDSVGIVNIRDMVKKKDIYLRKEWKNDGCEK